MTKRMLIDASHAEETRVVVLEGNRLEDYDVETATKKQLKGNIYLAKVVRVEPSLQAAFVEYGGNRHGFLAFGEIHPDYYQIPVADRQRLIELQEEEAREDEEEEERAAAAAGLDRPAQPPIIEAAAEEPGEGDAAAEPRASEFHDPAHDPSPDEPPDTPAAPPAYAPAEAAEAQHLAHPASDAGAPASPAAPDGPDAAAHHPARTQPALMAQDVVTGQPLADAAAGQAEAAEPAEALSPELAPEAVEPVHGPEAAEPPAPPETLGGDSEDRSERRPPPRFLRNYKIQEVIRRRQILLVQVVKEERGTKGAALTTYVSLAGRFSVLMPNSPRGGGISRKITSVADRKRLREVITELGMPRGMGLIVRTAGANRPKPEIKRDCEYLLRLWDDIRDRTMVSTAPALIYEEANLIKRTIRDVYSRDIDEVLVDGEDAWRAAREFMRMLMPSHARKVQLWKNGGQPLFSHNQVEAQLDSMLSPTVQLRSGGYLVINQTEALVAIDVNSGRSTRERGIEETALRTNLEAAEEVARQLRLRDLAGLIVIDFIDMEAKKHNAMVERRIKDALKNDRARIQVGHISHFGLLEMSRQRLRPSLTETSFVACPHCGGTGHVRSTESASLHVLRAIDEEGGKHRAAEIVVHVASGAALYILNHKRERLAEIESRCMMRVNFDADPGMPLSDLRIERIRASSPDMRADALPPAAIRPDAAAFAAPESGVAKPDEEEVDEAEAEAEEAGTVESATAASGEAGDAGEDGDRRRRRRRRRRRSGTGRHDDFGCGPQPEVAESRPNLAPETAAPVQIAEQAEPPPHAEEAAAPPASEPEGERGTRRRGARGGRRRRPETAPEVTLRPAYAGPTPADPFGGHNYDIFDAIEQASAPPQPIPSPAEEPDTHEIPADAPLPATIALPVLIDPTPSIDTPPPPAPGDAAPEQAMPHSATPDSAPPASVAPQPISSASAETIVPELTADAEPEPGPAIQPVVIANGPAEGERKRGWWRR